MKQYRNEEFKAVLEQTAVLNTPEAPLAEINRAIQQLLEQKKQSVLAPAYRLLGCMDEGVTGKSIGLGGPGIVLAYFAGKNLRNEGLQAVWAGLDTAARALDGEVDAVSSHDGCGACRMVYDYLSENEQNRFLHPDELGIEFARILAVKLNAAYKHIPQDEMSRPQTHHTARFVFYTGTEQFHIAGCFPSALAFTISRGTLAKLEDQTFAAKIGKILLDTACNIATGPHGAAESPTPEFPFIIVPVGGNRVSLQVLQEESREVAARFPGNVAVPAGFTL